MLKRSAQDRIERYARKIRKIEESKNRRRKIISPIESSSDDEGNEDFGQVVGDNATVLETTPVTPDSPAADPDVTQDAGRDLIDIPDQNENVPGSSSQEDRAASAAPDLDPELLSALGEFTSDSSDYGESIHDSLSKLWLPLLKKGMPKDNKEKLLKEYLIPDNCKLLQAPKLNAEISAAVPDMVRNRDKTQTVTQQQLGSGITAINRGIDLLLKSDSKAQAIKHLSNGCRLLCDSHYLATQSRIKLVTPSLDKSFLHMITESKRDESLFGSTLSEKIKATKAIEKQGLSIKKPAKPQKPAPQSSTRPSFYQGNWNPPPRYPANRGGRGGYNYRRGAPTTAGARRPQTSTAPQRAHAQDKTRAPAQSH